MPLIKSQAQYECVAKEWRELSACQRAMQDLDFALGKTDADCAHCLENALIEIDEEVRSLAGALADFDEAGSSEHEFAVSMGSAVAVYVKGAREMKDGDIYFWHWKNASDRFMPYHCLSCKAIVQNGQLVDTFWCASDNRILPMDEVDAEFMGNKDEMQRIGEHEIAYYRREDVVDMRHSNHSRAPIYVKVGAARDPSSMLDYLRHQVEKAKSSIRFSQLRIEDLNKQIGAVEDGRLADVNM